MGYVVANLALCGKPLATFQIDNYVGSDWIVFHQLLIALAGWQMGTFTVDALDELLQPKNHEDRTFCSVLDLKQHTAESDRPQVFSTYIKKAKETVTLTVFLLVSLIGLRI